MKVGQEASDQYAEVANALIQLGTGWIVTEVEQVIARGKTVPFRELSAEQSLLYENRLNDEVRRGLAVGRAKANDVIGVPYDPYERLLLLVDAIERVVMASELSYAYLCKFAARVGITSVRQENPTGPDLVASSSEPRNIPLVAPSLINERLSILRHVLRDEVLS